jgi:ATP synthase F1 delta subunit
MNSKKLMVKAYARSLFQNSLTISRSNATNEKLLSSSVAIIGEELMLLRTLFLNSLKLRRAIKNPMFPEAHKLEIIFSIFPKMSLVMNSFLKILAEKGQLSILSDICEEYHEILFKFKAATIVKLHLANALEESFGSSFFFTLKKLVSSKEIIIQAVFNPKLLGGFIIEYNCKSLDATLLHEISTLL